MVNLLKILNFYSIVITSLMLNSDAHGQVGGSAGYDSSLRAIEPKNIPLMPDLLVSLRLK